jgi:hypothetical protein
MKDIWSDCGKYKNILLYFGFRLYFLQDFKGKYIKK